MSLFFVAMVFSLPLKVVQIVVQAIDAVLPKTAVLLHPIGNAPQRLRFEPAGSPLCFAAALEQPRAFEHLEVLRNGGKTHVEGVGKLRNRSLSRC
jgi:hypothetical protein